jgi:hypothetical protein
MRSRQIRPLFYLVLVLALPLLVCQCGKKQTLVHGVTEKESAKLQDIYSPDYSKKMPRPDQKTLPPERLEALGEIALQGGDYESSLFNFLQILKDQPQRYDLRYKVGVILLLTGRPDAAKR